MTKPLTLESLVALEQRRLALRDQVKGALALGHEEGEAEFDAMCAESDEINDEIAAMIAAGVVAKILPPVEHSLETKETTAAPEAETAPASAATATQSKWNKAIAKANAQHRRMLGIN